jgi:hypothetical protein
VVGERITEIDLIFDPSKFASLNRGLDVLG